MIWLTLNLCCYDRHSSSCMCVSIPPGTVCVPSTSTSASTQKRDNVELSGISCVS